MKIWKLAQRGENFFDTLKGHALRPAARASSALTTAADG